jgi:filamentous hemagglutinin
MSERAATYQAQITGRTGQSYVVNGVKFDGVGAQGLLDAKGPGYANFVKNGEFQGWFTGKQALIDQANAQIAAAKGTPIIWHVAEQEAATAMQNLFNANGITKIKIVVTPAAP